VGRKTARLTFKSDFRGSGDVSAPVDEPDWGKLIQCSGMKKITPKAVTLGVPTGTGMQLGEMISQSSGAIRGVIVGLLSGGAPVHRLVGAGVAVVVPIVGTFTAAACAGESSGTTATASAVADYVGLVFRPTSRKLFNMVTAAACAVAVGEVVSIERGGLKVGAAQIIVNNSGFTNVDATLLHGEVANGDTVRAAAGGTTTISTGPTQVETLSGTAAYNEDGELSKILGARCDWSLGGAVGEPLQFTWTLSGNPNTPADAAPLTTSGLTTISPPRLLGAFCCYGNGAEIYRLATKDLNVANGGQVEPNLDANQTGGATGSNVVDRDPTIQVTVDRSHSAFPWRTLKDNSTPVRVAFMLGTTPGNIVGIVAPRCQVREVARSDSAGISTWSVTLAPARILESGDDDLYLVQL
jgi:hypothetical protein